MDTLVVNTSWLQSLTCVQVHLCMARGGSAHEWFSVGRELCHPLQGTSGNVWRHVMTAGEAASGIPWLEVIDSPKVLLCRGDLLHRPHLPHPTRNTSSKMAISLLLNPPGVMILGAVLCLHKCAMWTLMYNRELSPYTSCTSSEPHSAFPAALSDMFARGVSNWWVDHFALPGFPMGAYACASSNRFFLQLWSENFFNHKDFTMDIFIELTL